MKNKEIHCPQCGKLLLIIKESNNPPKDGAIVCSCGFCLTLLKKP